MSNTKKLKILIFTFPHYISVYQKESCALVGMPNHALEQDMEKLFIQLTRTTLDISPASAKSLTRLRWKHSPRGARLECSLVVDPTELDSKEQSALIKEMKKILMISRKMIIEWADHSSAKGLPDVRQTDIRGTIYDQDSHVVFVGNNKSIELAPSLVKVAKGITKDDRFRKTVAVMDRAKINLGVALPEKPMEIEIDSFKQKEWQGKIIAADEKRNFVVLESAGESGKTRKIKIGLSPCSIDNFHDAREILINALNYQDKIRIVGYAKVKKDCTGHNELDQAVANMVERVPSSLKKAS